MTQVVILSWDPGALRLEYVEISSGLGGHAVTAAISADYAGPVAEDLVGRPLPHTAEIEIDGDDVIVDADAGSPAVRCRVSASGPPDDRQFRLTRQGPEKGTWMYPAASLGVPDPDTAAAVASRFDYLLVQGMTPPGCWLRKDGNEGGIDAFAAQRGEQRRMERERREAEQAAATAAEAADASFINPYTFVPFPERIARARPAGHACLGEGFLSGSFTVTWEFTSPFQAPEGSSGAQVLRLPGSSVKGAVRSVHETLAGGCLRVFDDEFIPSYRDTVKVRPESWTLAVVAEATRDGQPLSVELCDEVVWVPLARLRAACGDSLRTGSRVTIADRDVPRKRDSLGRKELANAPVVRRGGDWVVLVTAPGTRVKEKRDKETGETRPGGYFLACGRLSGQKAEVSDDAWHGFQHAVAGADDMRTASRKEHAQAGAAGPASGQGGQPTADVRFQGMRVGRRRVVTGQLWDGDVIWARVSEDGGSAVAGELSLAAVWRHPGWGTGRDGARRGTQEHWTAGERVPGDLRACDDPELLCPSCRIFGSADVRARSRDDRSDQRAYAGHVRFGDACSGEPVELARIDRAPMGAPRPGAGQFYLAYGDTKPARDREEEPTREWGSAPDLTERRPLRGRKFYWHADPGRQDPPRHKARDHQKREEGRRGGKLVSEWQIAPPGTRLSQRITFDNLDEADLGGLLAAFEPHRVLPAAPGGPPLQHLGGGKPLGLGSCRATVSELHMWTAQSRYGTAPEPMPDRSSYDGAFLGQVPAEVTATWPALAAVLAEGTVDPALVWYPPGERWSERRFGPAEFDKPFAFFTASSGMALHDKSKPERKLIPLPAPGAPDQTLPIVTKKDL